MAAPYAWLDRLLDRGWLRALQPSELTVLLALGRFMNGATREAWPDPDRICQLTGLARSTVYGALATLGRKGLIESEIVERQGKHRSYRVELHRLVADIPYAPSIVQQAGQYPVESSAPDSRSGQNGPSQVHDSPTAMRQNSDLPEEHLASSLISSKDKDIELASSTQLSGTGNGELEGLRKRLALFRGVSMNDALREALVAAGRREGWTAADVDREWAAMHEAEFDAQVDKARELFNVEVVYDGPPLTGRNA